MTLNELKDRVVDGLGEDIIDVDTLLAGLASAYADMTSRGYRLFKQKDYSVVIQKTKGLVILDAPPDIRKSLFMKVIFERGALNASRMSISNPKVRTKLQEGYLLTNLFDLGMACIYYIKDNQFYIEFTDRLGEPLKAEFGYYAKLKTPSLQEYGEGDDIGGIELGIREEFSDAVVLFLTWYIAARSQEEPMKLSMLLNQYKYYMEDLLFELQHEDGYDSPSTIIVHEEE
jgi:hypothetical protein